MLPIKIQLPEHFLNEEIRCDYSISHKMKEIWAVEIDLLNEFMRVCTKYGIQWWADGGTLLGAVRHKGFIPWDDDIDVMLFRSEYDKLLKVASKEFRHPYFFQTEDTDHGSLRGHAQLRNSLTTGILFSEKDKNRKFNQGIFIDIFPIDVVPEDAEQRALQLNKIEKLKVLTYRLNEVYLRPFIRNKNNSRIKEAYRWIKYNKVVRPAWYQNLSIQYHNLEEEMARYNTTSSPLVAKLMLLPFKPRRLWQRSWFESTVYLPFESFQIPVPIGYKQVLDTFYGNWQEYVVGTSTHGGALFDVNKPYTEYIKEDKNNTKHS